MELSIKFPSQEDVIREETTRFRALTNDAQIREVEEMYGLYYTLMGIAPRPEIITRYADEEEAANRRAIREFATSHV